LSDLLPVQAMRSLALAMADQIGPLRRALMQAGLGPKAKPDDGMAQPASR
jgi:hypothetical protein